MGSHVGHGPPRKRAPGAGDTETPDPLASTASLEQTVSTQATTQTSATADLHDPLGPIDARTSELERELERLGGQRRFDRDYQPIELLGQGGMGEVRLCRDERVGRDVAMKVMREPQRAHEPLALARFLREARVQGQLEHPSILPVYDVGVGPDGAPYFTMRRLRGTTLDEILRGLRSGDAAVAAQYSRRELLSDFGKVCLAIDYAHTRGVIHRDLKPGNIMFGDFGEVYVLDWGVAKVGPSRASSEPGEEIELGASAASQTVAGSILGTLGYIAPEQLEHGAEHADARSDVYSLGAILFEILTRSPLHSRQSREALIASTLEGVDARAEIRALAVEVPPELEDICARATALAPERRYQHCRELFRALDHYLGGDRDLERRRALAGEHAAAAKAATRRAVAGVADPATRREALGEASRALALDPDNRVALGALIRLMLEPPAEPPPEVLRTVDESQSRLSAFATRMTALAYLVWLAFVPLHLWLGVRNWPLAGLATASIVMACAAAFLYSRSPRAGWFVSSLPLVCNALAIAVTSRIFGSLVIMPGLAILSTFAYIMFAHWRRWWPVVAVGCGFAAIVAPLALEWAGVIPPTYTFAGGVITIHPHITNLPEAPTLTLMLTAIFVTMAFAALVMVAVRRSQVDMQTRLQMHAWQLRQLVPNEAQDLIARADAAPGEPAASWRRRG